MQLHDLPDDVLRLVLGASFRVRSSVAATLKANLALLAVCRRWRHLALAAVYSDVAICYDNKLSRSSGLDDGHANGAAGKPDDARMATNLDLVVAAGCVQMAKQVNIAVDRKTNPLTGLGAAIRLMRTAAEEWKGVRTLDLSTPSTDRTFALGTNAANHEAEINQASAALAATMPGVCRVHFTGHSASSVVRELCGQLAVLCSDRLESLTSRYAITVPPDHTFRQLKSVSIGYQRNIGYQHPRVDPAWLVSLDLTWWPSNHSWAPFSTDDDSGVIEFLSLEKLSVKYWSDDVVGDAEVQHLDGHPWKLHFPRLDRLELECEQSGCPLLDYAVLPPRMDKIYIKAMSAVLVRVAEMVLPAIQNISIATGYGVNDDSAALAAANRILKSARASKEMELCVEESLDSVLPGSITCTSLTALLICADTSVDTMLGLIRTLPRLADLYVWRLTLDDIQEDISIPRPDEDCLMEPFDTRIKAIGVDTHSSEPVLEMLVSVAKYLLLRMPTLARLCSGEIPGRSISAFVDAYCKRYPHLASIKYRLGNS